jgi:hypothetical protein
MKYLALIGAIIFGLTAVYMTGFGAITSAIICAGLFVSFAIIHAVDRATGTKFNLSSLPGFD